MQPTRGEFKVKDATVLQEDHLSRLINPIVRPDMIAANACHTVNDWKISEETSQE
jgi:hypothetical protein